MFVWLSVTLRYTTLSKSVCSKRRYQVLVISKYKTIIFHLLYVAMVVFLNT